MAATLVPTPELLPTPGPRRPSLTLLQGGLSEEALTRTYRRRRVVAAVLAVLLAVAALGLARTAIHAVTPHAAAGATVTAAPGAPTVLVEQGDTLWSIARRIQPNGDVRSLVDQLSALHGPGSLQPGERIALPA